MLPRSFIPIWIIVFCSIISFTQARDVSNSSCVNNTIPYENIQENIQENPVESDYVPVRIHKSSSSSEEKLNVYPQVAVNFPPPNSQVEVNHSPPVPNLLSTKRINSWLQKTKSLVFSINYEIGQILTNGFAKLTASDSGEIHGQMGGLWYRYWIVPNDHGVTVDKKAISKVMHAVICKRGGSLTNKVYCVTINKHEDWQGTLLIGPNPKAMTETCDGKVHGTYNLATETLTWAYSGIFGTWFE